jgi:hypothetical protein
MDDSLCRACGFRSSIAGLGRHLLKCPFYYLSQLDNSNEPSLLVREQRADRCHETLPVESENEVDGNVDPIDAAAVNSYIYDQLS